LDQVPFDVGSLFGIQVKRRFAESLR